MPICMSKNHYNAENGLSFSNISRGSMPPTPLAWLHACGARLIRACAALSFEAAPLMKYHTINAFCKVLDPTLLLIKNKCKRDLNKMTISGQDYICTLVF